MNLKGSAGSKSLLRGSIHNLKTISLSAYAIAVKNGYKGTEKEWLRSLGSETDDTLSIMGVAADAKATGEAIEKLRSKISPAAKITSVSLPASKWTGSGSLYSQVVSVDGVTENSQVNLAPSVEQLSVFYEKDITFVTENDGGVVTIYVIGQKPQNDYVIQADVVEVIA